ncbi:MAG TPA: transglycosylase SLT domain-containing protein [Parvibaculum sp.]
MRCKAYSRVRFGGSLALALALAPTLAWSQTHVRETTPQFSDATPWVACERAAIAVEAAHKMPRALLVSVATAESGRFNAGNGATRPWPWTINAEGQSFYFDSKKKAVAATRRLLNAGLRSIDVGCMQVNLHYHPQAFASLDDAFEPATNVAYGATFLKQLHAKTKSWPKAIAQYHSESTALNQPYFARVIGIWTGERERIVALARTLKEEAVAHIDAPLRTQTAEAAAETPTVIVADVDAVVAAPRPAPMVLDSATSEDVHEAAVATVGLRLSIGDDEQANISNPERRPPPRVLDPSPAAPTVLADATPGA